MYRQRPRRGTPVNEGGTAARLLEACFTSKSRPLRGYDGELLSVDKGAGTNKAA